MIDMAKEELIAFGEAARLFPGRGVQHANRVTIWRWARQGAKGHNGEVVKLESVCVGGRLVTSRQAVRRFIKATTTKPGQPCRQAAHQEVAHASR